MGTTKTNARKLKGRAKKLKNTRRTKKITATTNTTLTGTELAALRSPTA